MSTEREYNEWIEMRWMDQASDKKRILLIGDSIVAQHGMRLHELIRKKYCVDYFATSKIVCDADFWSDLEPMILKMKYNMIIFNNGLHGYDVDNGEYEKGLADIVGKLKKFAPILVCRNNTPCFTMDEAKPNKWETFVPVRNAIMEKVMKAAGVPILDAYTLLKDKKEYSADGVHFHGEGYIILSNAEAELIDRLLS